MGNPESPIPGTKVRNFYQLSPPEVAKIEEWRAIRRSAQDRLEALHVKVLDCDRLMEGFMTQIKWDQGWNEGDLVAYDSRSQGVLCLEVEGK